MTSKLLRLTTFEQFLLWEDRAAYPWSCFVRLRFRGPLEREPFSRALRFALERHPLLRARVEARGRRLYWVTEAAELPTLVWNGSGGEPPSATRLDLFREPGSRFRVDTDGGNTTQLRMQFHHACCDGKGIFQFVADLLTCYHHFAGGARDVRLPEISSQRLGRRGSLGLTKRQMLTLGPRQLVGLLGAKEFLTCTPVPLIPHQRVPDGDAVPAGYPAIRSHEFSREETAQLIAKAKQSGVTLNDLLTRDLFVALNDFRRQRFESADDEWIRVMIPIDLRTPLHVGIPASNSVSSVFLDRRGADSQDAAQLLQGIQRQMLRIKRNRLGLTFVLSLRLCEWLPGGLKRQARRDSCSLSTIFSNVGRVLEGLSIPSQSGRLAVNGAVLEAIELAVPNRPYNCASFFAMTYGGRLGITLHFDRRVLTDVQGSELLHLFARQISHSPE